MPKTCLFLCLKMLWKAYYSRKQRLTISPYFLPWSPYFWFLKVGSPGYTRKPDALHRCSQDRKSRYPETETLYLQDRDETETLNPQDRDETETLNPQDRDVRFFQTLKTETRPRGSKTRSFAFAKTTARRSCTVWWAVLLCIVFCGG